MATWVLTQGSSTITFNSDPFWLMEATGVGSAPVRRLSQRGPLQDGVSDLGFRLEPRMITLSIMIVGASKSATDGHRDTLATLLKPGSTPVVLKYTRDDAAVRQIDCFVINQVDMPAQRGERIGFWQRVVVQLVAPDPLWYDPTAGGATVASSATIGWEFADNQIASSYVKEAVESPAQGANLTLSDLEYSNWSIALRTSPAAAGTEYVLDFRSAGSSPYDGVTITRTELALSSAHATWTTPFYTNSSIWSGTSAQNLIITYEVSSPTAGLYSVYRNGAYIGGVLHVPFRWRSTAGKKWRSDYVGANSWTAALTRAAIYNVALNGTQIAALNATLTNGDTVLAYGVTVTYSGNMDEYPILTVRGPITSPIITNGSTGDVLDFTGYTVADGTSITINCQYGYKTVVDSAGVNRIDKLTTDSDLSTWRFVNGTNSIGLAGSSTGANTGLSVSYYNRYLSQ